MGGCDDSGANGLAGLHSPMDKDSFEQQPLRITAEIRVNRICCVMLDSRFNAYGGGLGLLPLWG